MRPFAFSSRHVIVAGLAALGLAGCVVHTGSHTERSGRHVSPTTLQQIQPGKSREYVLALLGEPTTRTAIEGGTEIWRWQYKEKTRHDNQVLVLFSGDRTTESAGTSYVEFKDGVVAKAWQD